MKGSEVVFDSIDLLYYKLHKIGLSRGGSYTGSLKQLKKKTAKIKRQNTVDITCFNCCIKLSKQQKQSRKTNENKAFY